MSVLRQVSLVEHIKWQSSWGKFNPGRSFIFWGGNWAAWWCCGLHSCLIATTFQVRYLLRLSWCGDFPCDLPIQPGLATPKILKPTIMPPQLHSDHRGSNQLLSLPSVALLQNPSHLHKCQTVRVFTHSVHVCPHHLFMSWFLQWVLFHYWKYLRNCRSVAM